MCVPLEVVLVTFQADHAAEGGAEPDERLRLQSLRHQMRVGEQLVHFVDHQGHLLQSVIRDVLEVLKLNLK